MNYTIIKIPFDACIVERARRGTAKGPDAIQAELKSDEIKFLEVKELNDFEVMHYEVESLADKEYKKKNLVIGLGGDHSVSYGLMKAFSKHFKKPGLIYFDAHLDCEDDFLPPTHEDIVRAAVNEKFFAPENILMIGTRKSYPKEVKFVEEKGIRLGKIDDIKDFIKNKDSIYISIDIDVFDPKYAPGTGYMEKDGLAPEQVLPAIKDLAKSRKVKGIDVVEVSPPKDVNGITSKLAASLLLQFLK